MWSSKIKKIQDFSYIPANFNSLISDNFRWKQNETYKKNDNSILEFFNGI